MEGFIRPRATVLDDKALIPARNVISPAPNQFTHELTRDEPYYFGEFESSKAADGSFPAGAQVVLLVYEGGPRCRVVDGRGLYVEVAYDSLQKL
jgi:hypothetical protein